MNNTQKKVFDVIVVGGGHAGIEAAHAAATMGSSTLLITLDINKIGWMPCNPSIGGVGKGHIVYELSALGGLMPQLCTKTYLQARMLNTKKGPAVQGLRLQIDKHAYNKLSIERLKSISKLTLVSDSVDDIVLDENKRLSGILTGSGAFYSAPTVILTTGTFLNGLIHIGNEQQSAGRRGEGSATKLAQWLANSGLSLARLKTGTPPRLLRSSIDFNKLELQETEPLSYLYEFYPHTVVNKRDCYIAHTNDKTHTIIRDNLHLSAMYSGNIEGVGPRYCPSIEDKISRFADKSSHHVFVEPEDALSEEIYPSGLSTSLPLSVQNDYIHSIEGFENAIITQPGYAVEYDCVLPNQLHHTLEVKTIPGLFLAGQINGTTGYEEAAGQGVIAGINAHQKVHNKPPFIPNRNESYIGVMIDDLVTLSIDEPYRMFTSRAERRLHLRQDNVFIRLSEKAYNLGLLPDKLYNDILLENSTIATTLAAVRARYSHAELIKLEPESKEFALLVEQHAPTSLSQRALQVIEAEIRYAPYLEREQKEIQRSLEYQAMIVPATLNITAIEGLSTELKQKIARYKPNTIAQAALIPGMTPAALSLLIFKTKESMGLVKIKQTSKVR